MKLLTTISLVLAAVPALAQDAPIGPLPPAKAGPGSDATRNAKPVKTSVDADTALGTQFAGPVSLELTFNQELMRARVRATSLDFFGIVIISWSDVTRSYFVALPPTLATFEVLGAGRAKAGELTLAAPFRIPPTDSLLFGQAVAIEEAGITASGVTTAVYRQ